MLCRISIHALRVEGDPAATPISFNMYSFLSTPSGWRATLSAHAGFTRFALFLSTPSGWRATQTYEDCDECPSISIHALRVEGDNYVFRADMTHYDFYPRPPGGGRLKSSRCCIASTIFLSTPSGWRATSSGLLPSGLPSKFLSTPSGWRATA